MKVKLKVRMLLDRGMADLALNEGAAYFMVRVPNDPKKPILTCSAKGGESAVSEVKMYQLSSIWENDN
ncbi:hypothetical protein PQO03_18060 [Lentisphaera profundi]|jgi:hypothetical protein|uniref:Uncharacterized protein n=1 Tax=Lentisphaera profundi TaxID=1658616 RepID=A0ABY7VWT6_9BACT|nr:hypothetical protein [Lentisphaera profundi]WDE97733.1 hypothetical protein PQO03_18060 [Lentisphaera profundi]